MTIVVTGAAGHVGGNLVRALLARGSHVRALVHRDRRTLEGLDVETVEGDLGDPASLCQAFHGAEVVYHTAARISISMDEWPLLEQVNVVGTRNVVEACLECGVHRLVHFSSIHAYEQEPLDAPLDESRPRVCSPGCAPYDRSKAAGEEEVRVGIERGLDAVILNPTAILGPYDFRPSHQGEAVLSIANGSLPALVEGGFDWVDVRDIVAAAMRAEERAPKGAQYLLSGHWVSVCEMAATIEGITGARTPGFVCPIWLAFLGVPFAAAWAWLTGKRALYTSASLRALRSSNQAISHERATRELGYQPRPFRETIRDTLSWFAEAGLLAVRAPRLSWR